MVSLPNHIRFGVTELRQPQPSAQDTWPGGRFKEPRNAIARNVPPRTKPPGSIEWPIPPEMCHWTSAPARPSVPAAANMASTGIMVSASPCTSRMGGASAPSTGSESAAASIPE